MLAVIIDDDPEIIEDLEEVFPRGDVTRTKAYRYKEDFDKDFHRRGGFPEHPGIFLVDIRLEEEGSGFEVVKEVRRKKRYRKTPIVVMSNSDEPSDIATAYSNGASFYIVKGENPKILPDTISTMIDAGKLIPNPKSG